MKAKLLRRDTAEHTHDPGDGKVGLVEEGEELDAVGHAEAEHVHQPRCEVEAVDVDRCHARVQLAELQTRVPEHEVAAEVDGPAQR